MDEVEELIQQLKNPEPTSKKDAAHALGKIKDSRAVPALIAALNDNDRVVQANAAEALGLIAEINPGNPEVASALPALIDALKDNSKWVREYAANALGRIGGARAVPALIEALKYDTENVRWNAARALWKIGDARAVPALIDALKDKEADVRGWAVESLVALAGVFGEYDLAETFRSLKKYSEIVKKSGHDAMYLDARRWAGRAYLMIANAAADSKMPNGGLLLEGETVKPPKKPDMYRTRRAMAR